MHASAVVVDLGQQSGRDSPAAGGIGVVNTVRERIRAAHQQGAAVDIGGGMGQGIGDGDQVIERVVGHRGGAAGRIHHAGQVGAALAPFHLGGVGQGIGDGGGAEVGVVVDPARAACSLRHAYQRAAIIIRIHLGVAFSIVDGGCAIGVVDQLEHPLTFAVVLPDRTPLAVELCAFDDVAARV